MSGKLEFNALEIAVSTYHTEAVLHYNCALCGQKLGQAYDYNGLTIDKAKHVAPSVAHIESTENSGKDSLFNTLVTHYFCNVMHADNNITPQLVNAFYSRYTTWEQVNDIRTDRDKLYREVLEVLNGKRTPSGHVLGACRQLNNYIASVDNKKTRKVSDKRREMLQRLVA